MSERDAPYTDAFLYDLEYADFDEDLVHYLALAREVAPDGPIVELGCGTGRLTLPLARAGAVTLGVDRAAAMVDRLRAKLVDEAPEVRARVTLARTDYRHFAPPERVPLVLWPFNALHHLDSEASLVAMLRRIHGWVRPGATLALDAYLPDPGLYGSDPERKHELRRFLDPRTGDWMQSWEQGWWDTTTETTHIVQVYRQADGQETRVHLQMRMFRRSVLHRCIDETGWDLVGEFQDYEGTPASTDALKWVARLTARSRV